MTQESQLHQLWGDQEWDCYNLGIRIEREHQNALSRLVMEKHEAELATLRERVAELEAELAKAKKPLLTVDEVNALDKFVGDHDFGNEHNAMLKLKAQHCTYQGHHDCYGELWECAECGDIHCCIEGGDTDIELCDSCWAEKHKEGADHE